MGRPPTALGAAAHLTRPDGRVQVGVGPRAWVVEGWSPSSPEHDPASVLVRGLAGSAPAARTPAPYRVTGHGDLAAGLRRELRATVGAESDAGVVVLVSHFAVPVGTARRPDLQGTPVLPVVAQTGRVVLGPWAGVTGGPCLHCLDLHRTDLDPGWPLLAAALDDPTTHLVPPAQTGPVLTLVHALAALLVTGVRRDGKDALGVAYEVGPDRPHVVTRRWPVHPGCPWHPDPPDV